MRYLKKFEEMNYAEYPEVDDFISINIKSANKDLENFTNNTIGKVIEVDDIKDVFGNTYDKEIIVLYDDVPIEISSYFTSYHAIIDGVIRKIYKRRYLMNEVYSFGKTIEELKLRKIRNKFNI